MATGFIRAHFISLLLSLACGTAAGAEVALIGVIGDKAAVLALDGGEPKTVKVGQKWKGITVVSIDNGRATVEVEGKKRVLAQTQHYRGVAATTDRQHITLAADPRGHFLVDGAVNGVAMRFLVDTGATAVGLPAADALRIGLDYRKGKPGSANTAGGIVPVYALKLDAVRVGDIELTSVDAVVVEGGLDVALLGMSFLNRVEMQREGQTMTLIRRF